MTQFTYINGKYLPKDKAVVSVEDRGFRFGDGLFETMLFVNGRVYQLDLHLKRLQKGLEALKIDCDQDFDKICNELIAKNKVDSGYVRLSVSRGVGSGGYMPIFKEATVVAEIMPSREISPDPVKIMISQYRRMPPSVVPAGCKTAQGLSSTLAILEADVRQGVKEALQLSVDNYIAECSSSNIFWRIGDKLYTPSLDTGIVAGTIRDAVIRLHGDVEEGKFKLDALKKADEVFVTSVGRLVQGVKEIVSLQTYNDFSCSDRYGEVIMQEIGLS